jgi:spermidine/putrescine transport system ATP-binding protein
MTVPGGDSPPAVAGGVAVPDLQCADVSKHFGSLVAVDRVSVDIPAGSFFSILGPSGCGKTTLMRMIAGFEEPSSGDIRIKGRSVLGTPPNKRNVKMVFQHLALFPMMNVEQNIAYGLQCRGASKAEITRRVGDVLERIGLPDVARKEVGQLSGGQKQRIAIARCMVLDPDVLLLDEPLGALDLKLRERMKIELKLLQHQFNTTFVYITHDQSEALVMSDRVAVMNAGRFEQVGTPEELYHTPRSAFVAGFVGDSNRWRARVTAVDGAAISVEAATGARFLGRSSGAAALSPGDPVSVFVRPEAIAATRRASSGSPIGGGQNRLDGVVDSRLFNGANSRVLVRVNDDQLIEVDTPQADASANLAPGEAITLTWTREQTMCFRSAE